MQEMFRADLNAHVTLDDDRRVREIRHTQEYRAIGAGDPLAGAIAYLRDVGGTFEIAPEGMERLDVPVDYLEPREQGLEYRLSEQKRNFDARTYGFAQTHLNVPVWRAGLKVTIKQAPNRVIRSQDTSLSGIDASLPDEATIERYRRIFLAATQASLAARAVGGQAEAGGEGAALIADILGADGTAARQVGLRLIRGRFWLYRYDAAARLAPRPKRPSQGPAGAGLSAAAAGAGETPDEHALPFPVPPVADSIRDGADYMVGEITFEVADGDGHRMTWRALIELETGSILYLRSLSACVDAWVFENDPITKTGDTSLDSTSDSATLNPHVDAITLLNLGAPMGGNQSLSGSWANVTQFEGPDIPAPVEPTGTDFEYEVRTNEFASVSGYFHVDRIFRTIEDLGFVVTDYMANTNFPVPVDIRCYNSINAHCVGDGMGGIGHVGFGLMDTTDVANPLGRVCDPRVHLHEVLGHGILYEHVDDANFDFSHSAGDGLSGIYFDPTSSCKGVDGTPVGKPGDLRFTYVPWHPTLNRRFDHDVADGWAWGGSQDSGGGATYGSEQILATTHFNIYRSIGGDSAHLGRRQFASRMTMYLILRAIQNLTPATNPDYARAFAAELMAADALNWTSEGVFGGAYHKVIRWAFEKQGEYQTPLIVNGGPLDGTITAPGDPPDVDVYIDDGRHGEYPFQPVHWHTTTIWNRRAPDGVQTHEEPALDETNYFYAKIKNRGTQAANNVTVRGFHTKAGAGLSWPADFEPFTTAEIAVGTLGANDSEEKVVGPFEWTPNINGLGHDCVFMIVAADGDPSNIDNFTAGESIPEWRLVPNDNNIAQRNVSPVPGDGGEQGLMAGLDRAVFLVRNPNPERARIRFALSLPEVLRARGWRVTLDGIGDDGFELASGGRREVALSVHAGRDFTADEVRKEGAGAIEIVVLADDNPIGGMTYPLDPDLKEPFNVARGRHGGGLPTGHHRMIHAKFVIALLIAAAVLVFAYLMWAGG